MRHALSSSSEAEHQRRDLVYVYNLYSPACATPNEGVTVPQGVPIASRTCIIDASISRDYRTAIFILVDFSPWYPDQGTFS